MTAQPAETQDDYRIAIFTRVQEPSELARIFSQHLAMHPTDAEIWSHHVPGVLNESFSIRQAEDLITAINARGIHAKAFRRAEIPDLRQCIPVHHVRCDEGGLQVIDLHDKHEALIPWAAIEMLCVGELPRDAVRHRAPDMWNGSYSGHYSSHGAGLDPFGPEVELWITCRHPSPILRIVHDQVNYEYLGPRRSGSSTINFRSLLLDLAQKATNAWLTESTVDYLQHVHPGRFHFHSSDELLRYATLQALLAREKSNNLRVPQS